jgi:hypothetical protein
MTRRKKPAPKTKRRPRTKMSSSSARMPAWMRSGALREVCLIVGKGGAILWADASDSPAALPDSRDRWEAIWANREVIEVIAHSHPMGPSAFSAEDVSTMEALDSALGKVMRYMVVAPRVTIATSDAGKTVEHVSPQPWWAGLLRLASGMQRKEE